MSSSVGMMKFPICNNIWENEKCSKPPIGYTHAYIYKIIIIRIRIVIIIIVIIVITIFIIHTTFVDHIS